MLHYKISYFVIILLTNVLAKVDHIHSKNQICKEKRSKPKLNEYEATPCGRESSYRSSQLEPLQLSQEQNYCLKLLIPNIEKYQNHPVVDTLNSKTNHNLVFGKRRLSSSPYLNIQADQNKIKFPQVLCSDKEYTDDETEIKNSENKCTLKTNVVANNVNTGNELEYDLDPSFSEISPETRFLDSEDIPSFWDFASHNNENTVPNPSINNVYEPNFNSYEPKIEIKKQIRKISNLPIHHLDNKYLDDQTRNFRQLPIKNDDKYQSASLPKQEQINGNLIPDFHKYPHPYPYLNPMQHAAVPNYPIDPNYSQYAAFNYPKEPKFIPYKMNGNVKYRQEKNKLFSRKIPRIEEVAQKRTRKNTKPEFDHSYFNSEKDYPGDNLNDFY